MRVTWWTMGIVVALQLQGPRFVKSFAYSTHSHVGFHQVSFQLPKIYW